MKNKLDTEIEFIPSAAVRALVKATLAAAPDCFWVMPAATTGKHHPAISVGEGGLVRHTKAVVRIALHLLSMQGILPQEADYSAVLAACILHDCCKKNDSEKYTAFDHPLRAGKLIRATAEGLASGILPDCCKKNDSKKLTLFYNPRRAGEFFRAMAEEELAGETPLDQRSTMSGTIAALVESHMGRWNTDPRSGIKLPLPLTPLERLVHCADYLASRKDITLADIS